MAADVVPFVPRNPEEIYASRIKRERVTGLGYTRDGSCTAYTKIKNEYGHEIVITSSNLHGLTCSLAERRIKPEDVSIIVYDNPSQRLMARLLGD
ncbi:MAG: hypothetical protein WC613_05730 [Candidatus Aenigmatarchaeota archaeon]